MVQLSKYYLNKVVLYQLLHHLLEMQSLRLVLIPSESEWAFSKDPPADSEVCQGSRCPILFDSSCRVRT